MMSRALLRIPQSAGYGSPKISSQLDRPGRQAIQCRLCAATAVATHRGQIWPPPRAPHVHRRHRPPSVVQQQLCISTSTSEVVVAEGQKRMQDKTSLAEKLKTLGKLAELGGEDPIIAQTITKLLDYATARHQQD